VVPLVLYHYLLMDFHTHSFFRTALSASAMHVPLMSTKILNAPMWDDLNSPSGQLTSMTRCQRQIAMNLLAESLSNENELLTDVNIAALEGLVIYEVRLRIPPS
jgi:hypothetical protein